MNTNKGDVLSLVSHVADPLHLMRLFAYMQYHGESGCNFKQRYTIMHVFDHAVRELHVLKCKFNSITTLCKHIEPS